MHALALVLVAALAQTPGVIARGDLLKIRQYQTTSALNLFVDPTGSDTNACTSTGTDACLTIQGAYNKVPRHVRHAVNITAAAGSYAGAIVSGFTCDPGAVNGGVYINLAGTLANAVPATGTATGTASAGTAGSGIAFGTLTDGTQTWTVNNLRGMLIEITAGTGAGQIKAITSNTATVITIAGTWTAPTGTSTYALRDSATVITSAVTVATTATGSAGLAAGLVVMDDTCHSTGSISFEKIRFAVAGATRAILYEAPATNFTVRRSQFIAGGAQTLVVMNGGSAQFTENAFLGGAAAPLISASSGLGNTAYLGVLSLTGNWMQGGSGNSVGVFNTGTGLNANGNHLFNFTGASSTGIQASSTSVGQQNVLNTIIDCNTGGTGIGTPTAAASSSPSNISFLLSTVSVSNCTTGLRFHFPTMAASASTVTGTGNTTAIDASMGAVIRINSATTITGGTEISVDGTAFTLAALRALVPKAIKDASYGSGVFEL